MGKVNTYAEGTPGSTTKLVGFESDGTMKQYPASSIAAEYQGQLSVATINFTTAEIKASASKVAVAAQGENTAVLLHRVMYIYNYESAAFDGATTIEIICNATAVLNDETLTTPLAQTNSEIISSDVSHGAFDLSDIDNTDVDIEITSNASAGDGSLRVIVYYTVEDIDFS